MFVDNVIENLVNTEDRKETFCIGGKSILSATHIHVDSESFITELEHKDIESLVWIAHEKQLCRFEKANTAFEKTGIKETRQLLPGEDGFFDTPDCKLPFDNIVFSSRTEAIWVVDITDERLEKENRTKYAFVFIWQLADYYNWTLFYEGVPPIERIDVYIKNNSSLDINDTYAKTINDGLCYAHSKVKSHQTCYIFTICRMVSIINCKNVTLINNPAPSRLNKKRLKNGKFPKVEYKTIEIKLGKTSQRSNGSNETGITHRLHICRGHFKEYTAEKPLFGRLTGRYWWQPHARGDGAIGKIKSDYIVRS